jgi:hypothetical protein
VGVGLAGRRAHPFFYAQIGEILANSSGVPWNFYTRSFLALIARPHASIISARAEEDRAHRGGGTFLASIAFDSIRGSNHFRGPMAHCEHLSHSHYVAPKVHVCAECVALGDEWVHLRTCLACGHVGCCDSSKNRHATKHFQATGHPVIASAQPEERWLWCYVHQEWLE